MSIAESPRFFQEKRHCSAVCVCVWNVWIDANALFHFHFSIAGRHSVSLGLCPTKLPVKWDIQLGQLDVPAYSCLKWEEAQPKNLLAEHFFCRFRLFADFDYLDFSCTVFAIWHLRGLFIDFIIWIYVCAPQSNTPLRGHGPTLETSGKGFRITSLPTLFFMVILMNTVHPRGLP